MTKRKNNLVQTLIAERYLLWAIFFTIVIGAGLLSQISLTKIELDTDISSSLYFINNKHK